MIIRLMCFLLIPFFLAACSKAVDDPESTYTITFIVEGLTGSGLVIQNNGGDDVTISTNGSFVFDGQLTDGSAFQVTIKTQPSGQNCGLVNSSGTLAGSDIIDINLTCRGWQGEQLLEFDDTGNVQSPDVAYDDDGNGIAVWRQSTGAQTDIWASYYTAGASWGSAQKIETDDTGDVESPAIAFDGNGEALVVWPQWDGTRFNLWANRYVPGVGWGIAATIESSDQVIPSLHSLAVNSDGSAMVVWPYDDGSVYNLWANRYVPGTGWEGAILIESDNSGSVQDGVVSVDNDGNAIAVWSQSDGTRKNMWANRYEVGSGWSGPA